jgi:hypothetical protein
MNRTVRLLLLLALAAAGTVGCDDGKRITPGMSERQVVERQASTRINS